ncbi:hypothetical protein CPB85DRAFT_876940 [Mucidula mucida]|nr:hypothetical protein CPB85DRAFT_876940 [Mucidula mucida]
MGHNPISATLLGGLISGNTGASPQCKPSALPSSPLKTWRVLIAGAATLQQVEYVFSFRKALRIYIAPVTDYIVHTTTRMSRFSEGTTGGARELANQLCVTEDGGQWLVDVADMIVRHRCSALTRRISTAPGQLTLMYAEKGESSNSIKYAVHTKEFIGSYMPANSPISSTPSCSAE